MAGGGGVGRAATAAASTQQPALALAGLTVVGLVLAELAVAGLTMVGLAVAELAIAAVAVVSSASTSEPSEYCAYSEYKNIRSLQL